MTITLEYIKRLLKKKYPDINRDGSKVKYFHQFDKSIPVHDYLVDAVYITNGVLWVSTTHKITEAIDDSMVYKFIEQLQLSTEEREDFLSKVVQGITPSTPKSGYQLQVHGPNHTKPYYVAKYVKVGISGEKGFWQQISPSYVYKYSAINFAKRHNIILENQ